jgi:hypothetical protein
MASVGHEAVRVLLQKIESPSQPEPSRAVSPWFFAGDTTGVVEQSRLRSAPVDGTR